MDLTPDTVQRWHNAMSGTETVSDLLSALRNLSSNWVRWVPSARYRGMPDSLGSRSLHTHRGNHWIRIHKQTSPFIVPLVLDLLIYLIFIILPTDTPRCDWILPPHSHSNRLRCGAVKIRKTRCYYNICIL